MKKLLVGAILLALLSSVGFAKEVIATFKANNKSYEVHVGHGKRVYVSYAGGRDTGYEQGSSSDCQWKRYGRCVSYSSMISDIKYKVANDKY